MTDELNENAVIVYEEDLPEAPLRPMTEADGVSMLRKAFYSTQMNSLRAIEKQRAMLDHAENKPIPLEDYEFYYHKAQIVESILEGGTIQARGYCEQRQFPPEDSEKLIREAKEFIIAASQEYADSAKDFAIGRYNQLYTRLYEQRDYKGCALVQRCLDRLEGVDDPNNAQADLTQGLMSIMRQVSQEQPQPLGITKGLGPATKGVKTIVEVVPDSNINVEHNNGDN